MRSKKSNSDGLGQKTVREGTESVEEEVKEKRKWKGKGKENNTEEPLSNGANKIDKREPSEWNPYRFGMCTDRY